MTEFQSKTFKLDLLEGDQLESFKKDILLLKNAELSKLEPIIKIIIRVILSSTKSEERELLNKIVEEGLVGDTEGIVPFHRITNFFLKVFSSERTKDDSPEILVKDLSKELKVGENELYPIRKLLEIIKIETPRYEKEKNREALRTGLFPYLQGFNTTVELRGVFNQEFEVGDDINSYRESVKIEETPIPIISVAISLDSGTPDKFYFQASRKHLKWLIGELESALHKSKLLEERFNAK